MINNVYFIGPKDTFDEDTTLPASFGIAFMDGSKYHIRMPSNSWSSGRVEFRGGGDDVDEDTLGGKRVAAAALLEYTRYTFWRLEGVGAFSGDESYSAIGIKIDGDDRWHCFEGVDMDFDSDGACSKLDYNDVFLVNMKNHAGGRKHR